MPNYSPLLVTGSSRSGSTWVGETLALVPGLKYIYEPFNIDMGGDGLELPLQFMYISHENSAQYRDVIHRYLHKRLQKESWRLPIFPAMYRSSPLLKDPLAFFSAEWLSDAFDFRVVVTVRHPAAMASSRQRLGWQFDFSNFLKQPLLLRDYLSAFEAEIRALVQREHDIIDESILLWKIIYSVAEQYRQCHPDWIFIRHEDLCQAPIEQFQSLFDALELPWNSSVEAQIFDSTSTYNLGEINQPIQHSLKRNSRELVNIWRSRLSEVEIERIHTGVSEVSSAFYTAEEW